MPGCVSGGGNTQPLVRAKEETSPANLSTLGGLLVGLGSPGRLLHFMGYPLKLRNHRFAM